MKWLITEAGMVTWAAGAVWKVPPASMLDGGAGDSDTTTGKLVVPESPSRHRCSRSRARRCR